MDKRYGSSTNSYDSKPAHDEVEKLVQEISVKYMLYFQRLQMVIVLLIPAFIYGLEGFR